MKIYNLFVILIYIFFYLEIHFEFYEWKKGLQLNLEKINQFYSNLFSSLKYKTINDKIENIQY